LQEEVLLKYLYNPATDSFEALEPTMRDRFALGGGVIQGEKVGDRENFRAPVLDNPKFDPDMTISELKKAGIKSRVRYYSPDKGYALVTKVLDKNGRWTGKYETKFFKSHAAREKFSDQRLKSQRQVVTKTFDEGRKGAQKIDSNINNWVKDWFKKNSKRFKLGQYEEAMSKLKKDWAKESKKAIYKGGPLRFERFITSPKGFPVHKNIEILGIKGADPGAGLTKKAALDRTIDTPEPFYKKTFHSYLIKNNPAFKKDIKDFMSWAVKDKRNIGYKSQLVEASSWLKTDDAVKFMGEIDELTLPAKSRAEILNYHFPKLSESYLSKVNKVDRFRTQLENNLEDLAGVKKGYIRSSLRADHAALKKIFNTDKLPLILKYSGDHIIGIEEASKLNNKVIAKQAIDNILGKTFAQNAYLGGQVFGQKRRNLTKEFVRKGTTNARKIKIVDILNDLSEEFIPGELKYSLDSKNNLKINVLKTQNQTDRFASYFKEINKTKEGRNAIKQQYGNLDNLLKELKPGKISYLKRALKAAKPIAKAIPIIGTAIGAYDVNKALQAGITDPRDLYIAYEVSADVAAKNKAIREDPTGELGRQEITNLPDITQELPDSDEVAGLLEESGSPYMQFLQDGGQLSFEEFQKMQSIPQSDRPITGELDLPEMDQTMMAAQGGRVGFKDGSPNPVIQELLSGLNNTEVMDNILKNNTPGLEESMFGTKEESNLLQRLNQTLDPRAFPYYAAQITKGVALAPEFAARLTLAAPKALGDLAQGKSGVGAEFAENIEPKVTQKQVIERFGLQKILDDMDQDITGSQRTVGQILKMGGESLGPATGIGYFASAGKAANQIRKELQKYAGTATAAKELEKSVEEKAASLQMTRREFNSLLAGGGIIGLVKALGLDTIFPAAKTVAQKAAPEIITKGGTPKYFFDFVNLIKSKGDDITETAATVERQKVYDYNGYTMYEDMTTGKISIRKDTEGGATYSIGDGEYETVDGIIRKEEINYEPSETILNEKGKPVKVPDQYDEATVRPDEDGGEGDFEAGLDSIDDILELLSKDGKTYSKEELLKMGIDADALGNYPTGAGSIPEGSAGDANPFKPKKAGGGIIKLAGDDSGPPPKSGPTPHGLPYIAKNVRPIKERK
jgi:hypothetical protein